MRLSAALLVSFALGCQFDLRALPVSPDPADAGPSVATPRHASCKSDFPADEAASDVGTLATGRPAFDLYRDLPCEAEARVFCGSEDPAGGADCSTCLRGSDPNLGLCLPAAGELLEDSSVVSSQTGRCYGVVDGAAKRHACCAALPGFDCRPWPFAVKSRPGQLCAGHADCEAGLVCKDLPYAPGVGLAGACRCPEASDEPAQDNAADCELAP